MEYTLEIPERDSLFKLFLSTGWNDEYALSPDELLQAVSSSTVTVSALQQGELVGFGRLVSDGVLHGMIYEMIVLPSHQGRGIGSEILSMLLREAKRLGIREVQLFCATGREGFYRKHGFIRRDSNAPGMTYRGETGS